MIKTALAKIVAFLSAITLHAFLSCLFAVLAGAMLLGMVPASGTWHQAAVVAMMVLALGGVTAARAWLPPDLRAVLDGLNGNAKEPGGPPPPLPPADVTPTNPGKVALLLPLAFALHACGPAGKEYALRYEACAKDKGIAIGLTIPGQVDQILTSANQQDAAVAQLELLAGKVGIAAVECAVQAWLSGDAAKARPSVGTLAGQAFLAKYGIAVQ